MTICPCCETENIYADEDGAVEGPREFHADCWNNVEENYRFDESTGSLYSLMAGAYWFVFTSPLCGSLGEAYCMYKQLKETA